MKRAPTSFRLAKSRSCGCGRAFDAGLAAIPPTTPSGTVAAYRSSRQDGRSHSPPNAMAANNLPSAIDQLFLLGDRMADGMRLHGPCLMLGATSLERFLPVLTTARKAEIAFAEARGRKAAAGRRLRMADMALTTWLAKARLTVMLAFGNRWSGAWLATGFTHRGTNVPKRIGPRIELGRRLAKFLATHRQFEISFAGVTAQEARAHSREIKAAGRVWRTATAGAQTRKRRRDSAEKALRHEMRFVVVILSCQLSKSDPRWLEFGLKQPDRDAPLVPDASARAPVTPLLVVDFGARGEQNDAVA